MQKRIPEIDILRTLALVLMILFHFIYDLDEWTNLPIDVHSTFWFLIGKISALLFIFLSGVSAGLSKHPVRNGIRVLLWGLVISLVTFLVLPEQYVRFGILHFLGTMMILYPLLMHLPDILLLTGTLLTLGIGLFFSTHVVDTFWLLPFGLMHANFTSMDYYPLFPYSGATLLGILFYRHFYRMDDWEKRPWIVRKLSLFNFPIFKAISRHSLAIYLIHQPILLGMILALQKVHL